MVRPTLMQTVLDAPDHRALAEFYRGLLGAVYRPGSEAGVGPGPEFIEIEVPGTGLRLAFQASEQHRAPDWPDQVHVPAQAHLDLAVPTTGDLDAAARTAEELGATLLSDAQRGEGLLVLADPVGHPFCLLVGISYLPDSH